MNNVCRSTKDDNLIKILLSKYKCDARMFVSFWSHNKNLMTGLITVVSSKYWGVLKYVEPCVTNRMEEKNPDFYWSQSHRYCLFSGVCYFHL